MVAFQLLPCYALTMSVLLEGTVADILAWSDRRPGAHVSCRRLLAGASARVAHEYAEVALDIVHQALREVRADLQEEAAAPYFVITLHNAAVTAPASGWAHVDDDARHAVALEVGQQLRVATATYFGRHVRLLAAPPHARRDREPISAAGALRSLTFVSHLVEADLAQEREAPELIGKLERLQRGFGLSQVELAKMLRVRPQAIRKWQGGGGATPENRAAIDTQLEQLRRLESHFRPGLLPSILRRPAGDLKGRRPIDLVIAGKANQFADYVERVIADDRTA